VCWHETVLDSYAIKFAEEFVQELTTSPRDYAAAFVAGQCAVMRLDPRAVRRLCFLSATSLVDLDDEALDSAHGSGNETVMPQHVAKQNGGEVGAGAIC